MIEEDCGDVRGRGRKRYNWRVQKDKMKREEECGDENAKVKK